MIWILICALLKRFERIEFEIGEEDLFLEQVELELWLEDQNGRYSSNRYFNSML